MKYPKGRKGSKLALQKRIKSEMEDLDSRGLIRPVNETNLDILLKKSTVTDLYIIENLIESIYEKS